MVEVLAYTLPTLQLVCHLVTLGNSSINGTDQGNDSTIIIQEKTNEQLIFIKISSQGAIAPPTTTIRPLPNDYVVYPQYGAAYRVSNETVSWTEAKNRCNLEGAYLAELNSYSKIQSVRDQTPSTNLTHVGYELVNGTWRSARTGKLFVELVRVIFLGNM